MKRFRCRDKQTHKTNTQNKHIKGNGEMSVLIMVTNQCEIQMLLWRPVHLWVIWLCFRMDVKWKDIHLIFVLRYTSHNWNPMSFPIQINGEIKKSHFLFWLRKNKIAKKKQMYIVVQATKSEHQAADVGLHEIMSRLMNEKQHCNNRTFYRTSCSAECYTGAMSHNYFHKLF